MAPNPSSVLYVRVSPDIIRDVKAVADATGLSMRFVAEALLAKAMGKPHVLSKVVTDALRKIEAGE